MFSEFYYTLFPQHYNLIFFYKHLSNKKIAQDFARTQVTTGLSDGVNIEIRKGLSLKDKVRGPQIVADSKEE